MQQRADMFSLIFVSVLAVFSSFPSRVSACSFITEGSFKIKECPGYPGSTIVVDGRHVPYGTQNMRIQLEEPSKRVSVVCRSIVMYKHWEHKNRKGNQVRVSFIDSFVRIQVYWCDSFDGPKKAGIRCAVEAFSSACPGKVGDNHTCVYKVNTRSFSSDTVRKAVEIRTEAAAEIRKKAKLSAGVFHTQERVRVNTYEYEQHSFIVIPAGYLFCSFSKVTSVEDYHSATGYAWRCEAPTYYQTTTINGRCTILALCKTKSPCSASKEPTSGAKSTTFQPVPILLLLCVMAGIVRQEHSE